MASQKYVFSGEFWWSRVFVGQEDSYDNGPEMYKLTVVLDEESVQKYKNSGIKLKFHPVSKDEPEKMAVTFKRAKEARVFDNGTSIGGGTPIIKDWDGNPWDLNKMIGNGSNGQILVEKFDIKGKNMTGHRLEAVKVMKYVPYDPVSFEDSIPNEFADPVKVETEEKPKKAKATSVHEDMNDVVPF